MAFTGIMCTEAEIDQRSGASVSVAYTDTMKTAAVVTAEATVNAIGRYDFSTNWATIHATTRELLTDIVASMVAIQAINYDMSGYTTRYEAEDMLNVLNSVVQRGLGILNRQEVNEFIQDA